MWVKKERSAPPCFAGVPAGVFAALRLPVQEVVRSGGAARLPPPAAKLCLGAGALPWCHVDAGAAALADAADEDTKQLAACGVAWRGEPRLWRRASATPGEPAAAVAAAAAAAAGRASGCGAKADETPLLAIDHERLPLTSPCGSFEQGCPAPPNRLAVANGLRDDEGWGVAAKGLVVAACGCRGCGDGGATGGWGSCATAAVEKEEEEASRSSAIWSEARVDGGSGTAVRGIEVAAVALGPSSYSSSASSSHAASVKEWPAAALPLAPPLLATLCDGHHSSSANCGGADGT